MPLPDHGKVSTFTPKLPLPLAPFELLWAPSRLLRTLLGLLLAAP